MNSQRVALDAANASAYLGQSVLVELVVDEDPESYWRILHIVGVVLPMAGIYDQAYFMAMFSDDSSRYPCEIFLSDILTIRAIRHRDRQSSGNVLGRMTRPSLPRSGAALPARRNSPSVPSNGSTGAAHP